MQRTDQKNEALKPYLSILSAMAAPKFKLIGLSALARAARKILSNCELCERRCGVDRLAGELGFCGLDDRLALSSAFPHYGEESFLVPSLAIFFWGCNFSCTFCQNWTISQREEKPDYVSPTQLAALIDRHAWCKNINFVGGEPTPQLPLILESLQHVRANLPVVWNSNFYMSEAAMSLLSEFIDLWLSDWKYWSDSCAASLSSAPHYLRVIKRNHLLAARSERSSLVIRHLVLPGHLDCCSKPIMDFVARKFGRSVIITIMAQYRPEYRAASIPGLDRTISKAEFDVVLDYAQRLGLNYVH